MSGVDAGGTIRCDLVLLTWDHLEETRPCLESLFAHTRVRCRLFIVDNGSVSPAKEYLDKVRGNDWIEVQLLRNATNEGFPCGMNRGLRASTAPCVCLLNNDLLFTPGWLERLLEVADAHPELGVLNPASNNFSELPPRGMSLAAYAGELEAQRGQYREIGTCVGFCMLITRPVIERIGLLDETVNQIFFEDTDYCRRAVAAGFRCALVPSSYVWHHEHRTVRKMAQREEIFQENRRRFEQRWGRPLRILYARRRPLVPGDPATRQELARSVDWARRGAFIQLYHPQANGGADRAKLFRAAGLAEHADVTVTPVTVGGWRWVVLARLLARRKKPFDLLVTDDAQLLRWARRLRACHHALAVDAEDETGFQQAWQQQSHSPS
ncbi:MAG: glycosyltransferase family 2 protein [Candidatus Omnitrophica bacterium]|nr:glycosyltransferase family 2 protein [Candidatus Omnitrophota bacterium]